MNRFALVAVLALVSACGSEGTVDVPDAAGAPDVVADDVGPSTTGFEYEVQVAAILPSPACTIAPVPAKQFGASPCLLQIPDGVDCSKAVLYVGGKVSPEIEYWRLCEGIGQVATSGDSCRDLEAHATAGLANGCN